jgi:hypothetical protein
MRSIFVLAALLLAGQATAQSVYHQGYTRQNGTYVQPHYQSAPNASRLDNWSTRGNSNPYTGRAGSQSPYPALNAPRTSGSNPYTNQYRSPYSR